MLLAGPCCSQNCAKPYTIGQKRPYAAATALTEQLRAGDNRGNQVLDKSSNNGYQIGSRKVAHEQATPTQQSFWLMNQLEKSHTLANISAAYRIRGHLSESQIAAAIHSCWQRHPEARTLYRLIDSEIRRIPDV